MQPTSIIKGSFGLDQRGFLHGCSIFANVGDRCVSVDRAGNVYVSNGDIQVYDPDGKLQNTIKVPERPTSLLVSNDQLFITTASSLYRFQL
ncbi:SMP-30/gluconolactonase/LRE family protein [Mediterranea massiliensis]|uniref:SMP-30/gluconolactonase/LRE family protein n=1 Tax=Mediterranea massiliensis TaxID=1841865 RepID=UPI00338F6271